MKRSISFIQRIAIVCCIMMMGLNVTSCGSDDDDNEIKIDYGNAPKGVEAVDLGLPSGTRWASCNLGATKPEEYGEYYAWGETEMKEIYNPESYKFYTNYNYDYLGEIGGTHNDVAHVRWSGKWRMPTNSEVKELVEKCKYEWTTLNGVKGGKFTGPNGNSIFLPAAGDHWYEHLNDAGSIGYYWSSTQAPYFKYEAYSFYFT